MNLVVISGRLVFQPELKSTPDGIFLCNIRVAVKRPRTKDKSDFVDCVAWRQNAEFICRNFSKGQWIELTGSICTENYTTKNGNNRTDFKITIDGVGFGGGKKPEAQSSQPAAETDVPAPPSASVPADYSSEYDCPEDITDDELPFLNT